MTYRASPGGAMRLGIIVIGRNEGQRLAACLASARRDDAQIVYVDSGSTDGSVELAEAANALVVALDMSKPFTAARARNAGFAALCDTVGFPLFVQFVDGDCEIEPGWIDAALAFLEAEPGVVAVCGRRRERFPEASLYNRVCDLEWDTPVGATLETGGDFVARGQAFRDVGGFNPTVIAGEEPELAARWRAAGWRLWRLDQPMTVHDAAIHRFGQWWRRMIRGGHAFAEVSWLHRSDERLPFRRGLLRCIVWGGILPLVIIIAAAFKPAFLFMASVYPAQIARIAVSRGAKTAFNWQYATLMVVGKFAEVIGVAKYIVSRALRHERTLIEYR